MSCGGDAVREPAPPLARADQLSGFGTIYYRVRNEQFNPQRQRIFNGTDEETVTLSLVGPTRCV